MAKEHCLTEGKRLAVIHGQVKFMYFKSVLMQAEISVVWS